MVNVNINSTNLILTGSSDGTVGLWNSGSGKNVGVLVCGKYLPLIGHVTLILSSHWSRSQRGRGCGGCTCGGRGSVYRESGRPGPGITLSILSSHWSITLTILASGH